MQNILVAGATGSLGGEILAAVKSHGLEPIPLTRRSGLTNAKIVARMHDVAALTSAMQGVHGVISCLGASVAPEWGSRTPYAQVDTRINLALIEAAKAAGVQRFVYVAVACADKFGHLAYVRAHEDVVAALRTSGLSYAVVKPTGFFSAFSAFVDLASKGKVPVMGNPNVRTNPIHDADLADLCVQALRDPNFGEQEVGGPEVLTRGQIAAMACRVLGKPERILNVPVAMVKLMSALVRPLNPRLGQILAFYAAVSIHDCTAPAHGTRRLAEHFALHPKARTLQLASG